MWRGVAWWGGAMQRERGGIAAGLRTCCCIRQSALTVLRHPHLPGVAVHSLVALHLHQDLQALQGRNGGPGPACAHSPTDFSAPRHQAQPLRCGYCMEPDTHKPPARPPATSDLAMHDQLGPGLLGSASAQAAVPLAHASAAASAAAAAGGAAGSAGLPICHEGQCWLLAGPQACVPGPSTGISIMAGWLASDGDGRGWGVSCYVLCWCWGWGCW